FHYPQRFAHFFQEPVDSLLVHSFRGLQNVEVYAHRGRQMHERLKILGKTETTKSQARPQKLRADSWVETHGVRYFFHVRADLLAKIRDHVGVADLQRQERIRSMLDQLRAVDRRHQKFCLVSGRACSLVNRTMKTPLKNGPVYLSHLGGGG